jgi:hypothetical protein
MGSVNVFVNQFAGHSVSAENTRPFPKKVASIVTLTDGTAFKVTVNCTESPGLADLYDSATAAGANEAGSLLI